MKQVLYTITYNNNNNKKKVMKINKYGKMNL